MEPIRILTDQLREIFRTALEMTPQFVVAIVILVLTGFISKLAGAAISRVLRRTKLRQSLKDLALLLTAILVWGIGFMVAAVVMFPGLTPASILTGLGIGSVAIGFAFKDVFENFLAGIIILFRREMRIGDHIECQGIEGEVTQIAIRESHIARTDGQLVIVPNALLFKNPVIIRTDKPKRRVTIQCGVAYDVDVDAARSVITEALAGCDTVETEDKPLQVFAQEFGESSINFEVTWWTGSTPVAVRQSRDEVVAAVKRALDDAGMEIPFPYRTLTFKEPLPIKAEAIDPKD